MSNTPETDAVARWGDLQGHEIVHADFARGLERQRDELLNAAAELDRILPGNGPTAHPAVQMLRAAIAKAKPDAIRPLRRPPPGIPDPPEGVEFFGRGPLPFRPEEPDPSIYCFDPTDPRDKWGNENGRGFFGADPIFLYAMRIGSEIHRKNFNIAP